MAIVPFHIVDVFSDRPFAGNPAAIIPNATALTEIEMLQITDELSMEAGFVLPPESPGADLKLRFFTRRNEAVISGHVAIAAMVSLVDRGFYRATPDGIPIQVETGAGVLRVVLTKEPEGSIYFRMTLPGPRFGEPVPTVEVAEALDIAPDLLQLSGQGPQRVSCGFDQIVAPISDRLAMRGCQIRPAQLGELADRRGIGGVTLICPETFRHDSDYYCRFFCADPRGTEDIASATSLGAAGAFVAAHGLIPGSGRLRIRTEHGHTRGRPTVASVFADLRAGTVERIEVQATGVVVMRGSFHFEKKSLIAGG